MSEIKISLGPACACAPARRGSVRFLLVVCAVVLFFPALVVTVLYWTVGSLYVVCAAGARR